MLQIIAVPRGDDAFMSGANWLATWDKLQTDSCNISPSDWTQSLMHQVCATCSVPTDSL